MERLSRRLLAGVVVVCGFSGAALADTAAAATTIEVGTGPAGGTISPAVMGSDFLQPFGGMGSFDSTTDEFEPSFLTDLSDDTFTGSIRFPGGIAADFYDWKRAIGPQSERTDNAYGPNTGPSPSTVGPDEFGQLLDKTGASGLVTTNFSTGTAQEAADWVSYMTGSSGTWATERADNGHPQPYNVPMWEVGNEEQSAANSWRNGTAVSVGGPSTCVGTADCEYIYGGTTSFTAQPVVGFADRTGAASDSTGPSDPPTDQTFFVKYPPVNTGSQTTILVGGTKWTEVSSLAAAGPTDDVYTIDDTTGEITFGDGTNGAVPPAGAPITASYESGPHDGFVAFYEAMKAANPNIQVCATDTDTAFVQDAGSTIPYDCLQYHPYETATDPSDNIGNFEKSVMNAPVNELATLQTWQSAIQSAAGHPIPLELSEYGSIMGDTPDPTLVPYYYDSLDEALLNASQLATWINAGISVADRQLLDAETPAVADVAVGLPGGAPFATTGGIVTPGPNAVGPDVLAEPDVTEPTAQYFQLFKSLAGGTLLGTTTSNNPVLSQLMSGEAVGDLSVVAAATGDEIDTVVINRSPTDSVPTQLNLNGASDGPATITTLNAVDGGDALSFNTSVNPDTVSTTSSNRTVQNGTLAFTFPAHSISLVQVNAASSPPPAPVSPPQVGGNPPAPGQPVTSSTTPTATVATVSAKHVTPVTIQAIKLAGAKVTWCKRCTYPKTKLSFRLTGSAQVRITLLAKKAVAKHRANAETDWRKLAGVTVAGHKGANRFLVGKRWHKRLMPDATMQILVQMKSAKIWKNAKTLRLTVLAGPGHV